MVPPTEFRAEKLVVADVRLIDYDQPSVFRGWSPDGQYILVERTGIMYNAKPDPDGTPRVRDLPSGGTVTVPAGCCADLGDLWVMKPDGTGRRKIADVAGWEAWSPSGRYIAYTAPIREDGAAGGIYVVDVESVLAQESDKGEFVSAQEPWEIYRPELHPFRLGQMVAKGDLLGKIDWLPDDELVFLRGGYLHAIRPDGTEERLLNNIHIGSEGIDFRPGEYRLSPDGRYILYQPAIAPRRGEKYEWLIADLDGSNVRFVQRELAERKLVVEEDELVQIGYHFKEWSPDGHQLAFTVSKYWPGSHVSRGGLGVINADGSNPHMVYQSTQDFVGARNPTWSPDGQVIIFAVGIGVHNRLCFVNQDGTGLWCPEEFQPPANFPQWSPTGTQIAYDTQFGKVIDETTSDIAAGVAIVTLATTND